MGDRSTIITIREMTGNLNKLCGLPLNLGQAGVTEDKLESIAKATINDGAISFSPVEVIYDEALGVLRLAL